MTRFHSLAVSTVVLVISAQVARAASPCDAPRELADGWAVEQNRAAAGFEADRLCDVIKDFAAAEVNYHALVIVRRGRLVADVYRRGKDKSVYSIFASTIDFEPTTRHDVRSVTKSIVSLLWGIAASQGKTPPLNTPALDFFPELTAFKSDGREKITLEHLFTMSSGLDWNETGAAYGVFNVETGLYWHSSQARFLFDRAMLAPAGNRFNYNGGGTAVLAQILANRVDMRLAEYARKYLFEPLGITDWEWINDLRGRPLAFAGLRMRPRELARIGQLMLAHGEWGGKHVVPAEWISESTRPRYDAILGHKYGYQWWLDHVEAHGHQYDWIGAIGNGGQRLFVLPDLDMVVVMTAAEYGNKKIYGEEEELLRRIVSTVRTEK